MNPLQEVFWRYSFLFFSVLYLPRFNILGQTDCLAGRKPPTKPSVQSPS